MKKIAINGFGRIGRLTFKCLVDNHPGLDVVAVNDLTDPPTLAHLLKYDSSYGRYNHDIGTEEENLLVGGKKIKIIAEKDPANLPWKDTEVDVVLECTGLFTEYEDAKKHLDAGVKKVIISAPSKSLQIPTYILGVNADDYDPKKDDVISMASCTTNALAPVVKILHENFVIKQGFMTTAHSYTNDQRILDLPHKDLRRARAAAINIIPTTTGAAKTVAKTIPALKDKLDGISWRVPTPTVSIVEFTCVVKNKTSVDEVNRKLKDAAGNNLKNILGYSEEPLVSADYRGDTRSGIIDAALTMVKDNLVKVNIWYDNEWGYSCRLAEMAEFVAGKLL
jgi:glyceraldehyde 3-phosphate dehydrogenase